MNQYRVFGDIKQMNSKTGKKNRGKGLNKGRMSVVKYDPEYDVNFHDIDMNEFQAWNEKRMSEYIEDLDIIAKLKALCPWDEVVYGGRLEVNNEQRKKSELYDVLYGFHEVANEKYMSIYGNESSDLHRRYEKIKEKAKSIIGKGKSGASGLKEKRNIWDVLNEINNDSVT